MSGFDAGWLAANAHRVIGGAGARPRDGRLRRCQPSVREEEVQAEVMRWARGAAAHRPALRALFHPANGEYRPGRTAGRLRAMGVVPGVPDLVLLHPAGRYHGLAVELKAGENDVTPEQARWLRALDRAGYAVTVCWTADQAVAAITEYLDDPDAFVGGI